MQLAKNTTGANGEVQRDIVIEVQLLFRYARVVWHQGEDGVNKQQHINVV